MKKKVLFLPGDGIGHEVMTEAYKVLKALIAKYDLNIEIDSAEFGGKAIDKFGHPFPKETYEKCMNSDAIMLGAVGEPKYESDNIEVKPEKGLLQLRKTLGVYLNIRPVSAYKSLLNLSPLKEDRINNVDFEIYRELTGGIYFGEKGINEDGSSFDICSYTEEEIVRVLKPAFQRAMQRRKKLCLIDKANVLETSKLWRRITKGMESDFPEVTVSYLYVDNAAMQMILNPSQFDVIVTSNMFGDIISDEASVIAGSIGLLPSASVGDGIGLFEPIHGSYPEAAGLNIANPIGAILSLAMMLNYLNFKEAAADVINAVQMSIDNGYVTKDLSDVDYYFCSKIGDFIELLITDKEFYLNITKHNISRNTII